MISGIGIHGGQVCRAWLHREEGPLQFRRGKVSIPATVEAVVSTERSVTLGASGGRISTVEHLLAALHIAGFWSGVVIEVDANELPILDGSALPWCEAIVALGEPPAEPPPLVPPATLTMNKGETSAKVIPGKRSVEVTVDYPHPAIGRQSWSGGPQQWPQLQDARTFGFLAELDALRAAGLAAGATTENAIVFDESGPLCPLRYANEPVRHKALDLIGDLALLGRPLAAEVRVERGSHRLHVELMRDLLACDSHQKASK